MSVNSNLQKKAFTLIELIIVVIIMGVVYNLAIVNITKANDTKQKLTLRTLKEYLAKIPHHEYSELVCLDDCSICKIVVDGNVTDEIKNIVDENVQMYRYDDRDGPVKVEPRIYFNSEDVEQHVCFDYKMFRNGVGDQIFVENREKYYDFTRYFEKTTVYETMEDLVDARD